MPKSVLGNKAKKLHIANKQYYMHLTNMILRNKYDYLVQV